MRGWGAARKNPERGIHSQGRDLLPRRRHAGVQGESLGMGDGFSRSRHTPALQADQSVCLGLTAGHSGQWGCAGPLGFSRHCRPQESSFTQSRCPAAGGGGQVEEPRLLLRPCTRAEAGTPATGGCPSCLLCTDEETHPRVPFTPHRPGSSQPTDARAHLPGSSLPLESVLPWELLSWGVVALSRGEDSDSACGRSCAPARGGGAQLGGRDLGSSPISHLCTPS